MSEASSVAANGRRQNGTFAPGHKFAKGKPHAAKVQKLRSALLNAVKVEDLKAIVTQLVTVAKEGDVSAAKLLFDRLLGPPLPLDIEERLKAVERLLQERLSHVA
jgi:hypothetical protein